MNIGGEDRPVAFTVNALLELKESHGIDFLNLADGQTKDIKFIRAILFVGLKHGLRKEGQKDCPFSIDDVGDWLPMNKLNDVLDEFFRQAKGSDELPEGTEEAKK